MTAAHYKSVLANIGEDPIESRALLAINTMQRSGVYQALNPSADLYQRQLAELQLPLAYGNQQTDVTTLEYGNIGGDDLFAQNLANMFDIIQNHLPQRDFYKSN